MKILAYDRQVAEFAPYDEIFPRVARAVADLLTAAEPALIVEHFGSTSIPGCGGKGIIDLAVLYPEGGLERARAVVDGLGFQRQGTRDPWPESRPMRLGAVDLEGRRFCIHAHVIAADSDERGEILWFRDHLRRNPELVADYERAKRDILARGVTDTVDYSIEKGDFVQATLAKRG